MLLITYFRLCTSCKRQNAVCHNGTVELRARLRVSKWQACCKKQDHSSAKKIPGSIRDI